jgi:hypothetical protein
MIMPAKKMTTFAAIIALTTGVSWGNPIRMRGA